MISIEKGDLLEFIYINYRGEESLRKVVVDQLFIGSNQWHPENQFLMTALDIKKSAMRCFAVKDMSSIEIFKNRWYH